MVSAHSAFFRPIVLVLSFVAFAMVPSAWSGPYLFVAIEKTSAVSKSECDGRVVQALNLLQQQRVLTVASDNKHTGFTSDSTLNVDCILDGTSKEGQRRWIFYIAIASTNEQESKSLLERARWQLTHLPAHNTL